MALAMSKGKDTVGSGGSFRAPSLPTSPVMILGPVLVRRNVLYRYSAAGPGGQDTSS